MADWRLVLLDVDGTPVSDLADASDIKVTFRLFGPTEVTWQMSGYSDRAPLVKELLTDVLVMWGDRKMARCRVGDSSDDLDGTDHRVTFAALDYRGLLGRRFAMQPLTMTNLDLTEMGWRMINYAQHEDLPYGSWGIGYGTVRPCNSIQTYTVASGKSIEEGIGDIAVLYPGFDWEIDAEKKYNTWPMRGAHRDFGLEYGGNVIKLTRDLDVSEYANAIRQSGAEGVPAASALAPDLASRKEGRFDSQEGNPDLTNAAAVTAAAQGQLSRKGALLPGYRMTLAPGVWNPDRFWLGDIGWLIVRSGRINVTGEVERAYEITVTQSADGGETVELGFGSLRKDLRALLRAMPAALDDLYRR